METNDPYLGVASPEATEIAVERWFQFMCWPGCAWLAILSLWVAPLWLACIIIYLALYAALAYAWPGAFQTFWRDMAKTAPAKLRELLSDGVRLIVALFDICARLIAGFRERAKSKPAAAPAAATAGKPRAKAARRAPDPVPQRMVAMGLGDFEGPAEEPRAPEEVAPRRRPASIDWGKLGGALLNPKFWAFVLVCIVLITLARCADGINPLKPPSGREVAADARANQAEANARTNAAETQQREDALGRVDARNDDLRRLEQETETARAAIQAEPQIFARIELHRAFVQRMRDEAARSSAAAVSDYRSSVGA